MNEADHEQTWSQARELFLDIADLPEEVRAARLAELEARDDRLAGYVRRLLAKDLGAEPADAESTPLPRFGAYQATRLIAEGGMGEVYLAQRSDGEFERQVAIKTVLPGRHADGFVERFMRERQTLARFDHEYIASLIDGGTSEDGKPYLVLEYVEGERIDAFCRRNGLTIRERVQLFAKVLRAVQYAHEHDVVHRDLKPSNILVRGDGNPRLLDFGIARVVARDARGATKLTGTGERLFTPEFASPEQIKGEEISPATDIFALGTILYGLLAEVGPWESAEGPYAVERFILERDPVPPSKHLKGTLLRAVRGDLDTIVLACLHKEPAKRYKAVSELADEIERHLNHVPILTRPTRTLGRMIRHGRRNPWQTVAAALLLSASVVTAVAWRSNAVARERRAELVVSLRERVDSARNMRDEDRIEESRAELKAVVESLASVDGEVQLETEVLTELARVEVRALRPRVALDYVDRALNLIEEHVVGAPMDRVRLMNSRTNALQQLFEDERSLSSAHEALTFANEHLPADDDIRLEAVVLFASQMNPELSFDERIAILDEAAETARARNVEYDQTLGSIMATSGHLLVQAYRFEDALPRIEEAFEIVRWYRGERHPDVARLRDSRGVCLLHLGRHDEAGEELSKALDVFTAVDRPEMRAMTLKHLAELSWRRGDYQTAVDDLWTVRDFFEVESALGLGLQRETDYLLARVYADMQQWDDARSSFESCFKAPHGMLERGPYVEAESRYRYARVLLQLGERDLATAQLERSIEVSLEIFGPDHPNTRAAQNLLPR